MPAWKSKRVQQNKNKRWKKSPSPSPRNSRTQKRHIIKKIRTTRRKSDRVEFSKFVKSRTKGKVWKPKTRKKSPSPKRKKPKSVKKSKRWTTDWDHEAMFEVSPGELKRHREQMNKTAVPAIGLPNWPPKAPSPSKIPPPSFKPSVSPTPSINLTEDDYKVLASAVKDAFKSKTPTPTPKLLRPMDLKSVKTKRDPNLLTPAQILLMNSNNVASGPTKKRKKRKSKKKKTKKRKKRKSKKIKQKGGEVAAVKVGATIAAALKNPKARNNKFSGNVRELLQGLTSVEQSEEIGLDKDNLKLIKKRRSALVKKDKEEIKNKFNPKKIRAQRIHNIVSKRK